MPTDLNKYFAERGGKGFPFPETKQYSGRLVVCGDGRCLWDDIEKLGYSNLADRGCIVAKDAHFMVVNQAGEKFPGAIEHWYSNDAKNMTHWIKSRRPEYEKIFPFSGNTHSNNAGHKYHWPFHGPGSSGLNAVLVGLALGYDEIILCGMPLDDSGHNGEPHWRGTNFTREVADTKNGDMNTAWKQAMKFAFQGKVKSMSGRTKEWLGS